MISFCNGILRDLLQLLFLIAGPLISLSNASLRKRTIPEMTGSPVSYEDLQPELMKVYIGMTSPKYWAETSGTTSEPKRIPYDRERTSLIQNVFLKSMITLTSPYKGRKTFFVFSSLDKDDSLTSGLVHEGKKPSHIELLQAPYRFLFTTEGKLLREQCGDLPARVILLAVTQPRFLYATNPSTLTHFFSQVSTHWRNIQESIDKFFQNKKLVKSVLSLADGNARRRLQDLRMEASPDLTKVLPRLQAFISWDGGYTGIFVEQLKKQFPSIDHIPMFSMSTEAIETIPHRINGRLYFLPAVPHTYAEFLDEESGNIIPPHKLTKGKSYSLLISDKWGLKRYDTQDIFLVRDMIDQLPDLVFRRRRNRTSSTMGEKITEVQVALLFSKLKEHFPELAYAGATLFPRESEGQIFYQLMIIGAGIKDTSLLSRKGEEYLKEINSEYKSKVDSGRLLPMKARVSTEAELAALMGKGDNWESQFKVLPLYEKIVRVNS